jgi:hypothetical protein
LAFSSTSGIIGTTTNNSAAAGSVGEIISTQVASGGPTTVTTATPINLMTLPLTAGDWDVYANTCLFSTVSITSIQCATTVTSATIPDSSLYGFIQGAAATQQGCWVPTVRMSLATTTNVYMVMNAVGVGVLQAVGFMYARRVR